MDFRRCHCKIKEECRAQPAITVRGCVMVPESAAFRTTAGEHVLRAGKRLGGEDRGEGRRVANDRPMISGIPETNGSWTSPVAASSNTQMPRNLYG
jgi:hypothetical protein